MCSLSLLLLRCSFWPSTWCSYSVMPLAAFGLFSAVCVLFNFCFVLIATPAAVVIWHGWKRKRRLLTAAAPAQVEVAEGAGVDGEEGIVINSMHRVLSSSTVSINSSSNCSFDGSSDISGITISSRDLSTINSLFSDNGGFSSEGTLTSSCVFEHKLVRCALTYGQYFLSRKV